jgi:hypothetical protein
MINPIPGTIRGKNNGGYKEDTGLDILVPVGTKVICPADGFIIYSEKGHTPWNKPPDTPYSVLIKLKEPFIYNKISYNYIWFTHLSKLEKVIKDNYYGSHQLNPIKQGDAIGRTGTGNRIPHLHFGIVQDRAQTVYMNFNDIADIIWGKKEVKL